jgi:hypothetical protein
MSNGEPEAGTYRLCPWLEEEVAASDYGRAVCEEDGVVRSEEGGYAEPTVAHREEFASVAALDGRQGQGMTFPTDFCSPQ